MRPYLNTLATACNESGLMGGSWKSGTRKEKEAQLYPVDAGLAVIRPNQVLEGLVVFKFVTITNKLLWRTVGVAIRNGEKRSLLTRQRGQRY